MTNPTPSPDGGNSNSRGSGVHPIIAAIVAGNNELANELMRQAGERRARERTALCPPHYAPAATAFPFLAASHGCETKVTSTTKCPICNHNTWCLIYGSLRDPAAVLCMREQHGAEREIPYGGGDVGYLHLLPGGLFPRQRQQLQREQPAAPEPPARPRPSYTPEQWAAMQAGFVTAMESMRGEYDTLGVSLGISAASLRAFGVGWADHHAASTAPMYDAAGRITGIQIRGRAGKYCVHGSRQGIFAPTGALAMPLPDGRLLIAEGMSDAATLRDWGYAAIGRPSCSGGVDEILPLVQRMRPNEIIVVADRDAEEQGQRGAERLADGLNGLSLPMTVKVILPPVGTKDIREWRQRGAAAEDILAAPPIPLTPSAIRVAQQHAINYRIRENRRSR